MARVEVPALQVLLVEDDPGDIVMIREALEECGSTTALHVVRDGIEGLAFLLRTRGHEAAAVPDLIILDLYLPRLDGHQVLERIKADKDLAAIPVVVFTASSSPADVRRSYELRANAHVIKPSDFAQFAYAVRQIDGFFFHTVTLPGAEDHMA